MDDVKNPHVVYRRMVESTRAFVDNSGKSGTVAGKFAGVLDNTQNKKAASPDSTTDAVKKDKEEKIKKAKDTALKTEAVISMSAQTLKPIETPNKDD